MDWHVDEHIKVYQVVSSFSKNALKMQNGQHQTSLKSHLHPKSTIKFNKKTSYQKIEQNPSPYNPYPNPLILLEYTKLQLNHQRGSINHDIKAIKTTKRNSDNNFFLRHSGLRQARDLGMLFLLLSLSFCHSSPFSTNSSFELCLYGYDIGLLQGIGGGRRIKFFSRVFKLVRKCLCKVLVGFLVSMNGLKISLYREEYNSCERFERENVNVWGD